MAKKTPALRGVKGSSASTKPSASAALGKVDEAALIADLRDLIQSARERVATVANAAQTLLYWRLGRRLVKENLQDRRAPYGKRIVVTVSRHLGTEFGEDDCVDAVDTIELEPTARGPSGGHGRRFRRVFSSKPSGLAWGSALFLAGTRSGLCRRYRPLFMKPVTEHALTPEGGNRGAA